jgi:2-dehydro-3-deoxyphosphogluconate aldolase / (4S)-4-hydroxy-2-oxoglutarate aldolase
VTKQEVRQRILDVAIVPVVRAESPELAIAAACAIAAGGIPIVEITMTVPCAMDVIAELSRSHGGRMLIGAGTVWDADTACRCLDAGAQFLVSPGFDADMVKLANHAEKLVMAGALTPNEVRAAWKGGSDFVKIFPCGNAGGVSYIKALKTVLPQVDMVPTGGVNLANAASFLRAGASAVGVGAELLSSAALDHSDFAAITETARQFAAVAQGAHNETSLS